MLSNLFNFGGPGWFNDVIRVQIELQAEREVDDDGDVFVIPWHAYKERVKVFESNETIRGVLRATAPDPHKIWHNGIKVVLEEYITYLDPFVSNEVFTCQVQVAPAGYIEGTQEFPFEINLAEQTRGATWLETYNGKAFGIRHMLVGSVSRPWWTFDCNGHEPIAIYKLTQLPPAPSSAPIISIADSGSKIEMEFNSTTLDVAGNLVGTLRISDVAKPLKSAQIVLLTGEFVDTNVHEGIAFTYLVFGENAVTVQQDPDSPVKTVELVAPDAASYGISGQNPLTDDAFFNFDISLRPLRIHPSFDTISGRGDAGAEVTREADATPPPANKADADKVALRYYLRLIVQDVDGVDYWNSQEIHMVRCSAPLGVDPDV